MDYIIRKREQKDCKEIAHIVTLEWNRTYKGLVPDASLKELYQNEEERAIRSYNKFDEQDNDQLVLEVEGNVVGFVKYGCSDDAEYDNCGEIFALYILDEYHGNGFGRKLVERAKEELKKIGYDKMIIACLKGNPSNDFYEHIGGIYIKDGVYKRLNLEENIYYYKL